MGPVETVGLTLPALVVVVALAVVLSAALLWLVVSFAVRRGAPTTASTSQRPRASDPDPPRG